jgi:hypothetical protein
MGSSEGRCLMVRLDMTASIDIRARSLKPFATRRFVPQLSSCQTAVKYIKSLTPEQQNRSRK